MSTTTELIKRLAKKHPELESRCKKAELLVIRKKMPKYWLVQSQSNEDEMYDVWIEQSYRCPCIDNTTKQAPTVAGIRLCKHAIRVLCECTATECN